MTRRIENVIRRRGCRFIPAAILILSFVLACDSIRVTQVYQEGAIVSASPIATEIGLEILRDGGNAFDAAVAVGFALAVAHPEAGNIGGGGFALLRQANSGEIRALDFREWAPAAATDTMYLDQNAGVIEDRSTVGALSSGVPGTVAGLYDLWEAYGSFSWEDLLSPAADLADSGFIVDNYLHGKFNDYADRLRRFPETADQFLPNGTAPEVSGRLRQPDLARSLYLIAGEGKSAFYQGEISQLITATMQKYGGLIDSADLSGYHTRWLDPLHFKFDSLDFYSMPLPSSGGIIIAQILKLLEPYDFSTLSWNSGEYIHLFCEASRLAFADRFLHLGDPDFYDVPQFLLDSSYIAMRRKLIDLNHAASSDQVSPGSMPGQNEGTETTHYSVIDAEGNIVSITYTINSSFGSKLVVDGAGFLLNNEMDDFSIKPGVPNLYGLVGSEANKIEPRKRMLSSMAPTIVLKDGQPYLTLGSKGGSQIITALAAVILNLERFGLDPEEALAVPRYHHQWLPDEIFLQKSAFDTTVIQDLIRRGHTVEQAEPYSEVNLIKIEDGLMIPVTDPRTRGTGQGGI